MSSPLTEAIVCLFTSAVEHPESDQAVPAAINTRIPLKKHLRTLSLLSSIGWRAAAGFPAAPPVGHLPFREPLTRLTASALPPEAEGERPRAPGQAPAR